VATTNERAEKMVEACIKTMVDHPLYTIGLPIGGHQDSGYGDDVKQLLVFPVLVFPSVHLDVFCDINSVNADVVVTRFNRELRRFNCTERDDHIGENKIQ
jgi:hypothetical protein